MCVDQAAPIGGIDPTRQKSLSWDSRARMLWGTRRHDGPHFAKESVKNSALGAWTNMPVGLSIRSAYRR
jgi:hypothetical protein